MPNSNYLSLEEAARRYHVKEKVLTQLIADGKNSSPKAASNKTSPPTNSPCTPTAVQR